MAENEATKDELYEEATRLGIEGRSKMNKEELAAAIDQAGEVAAPRDTSEGRPYAESQVQGPPTTTATPTTSETRTDPA